MRQSTMSVTGFFLSVMLVLVSASSGQSLSAAFTYQGRLTDGGVPADAKYDFKFSLFDALSGGRQIGSTQTPTEVGVYDGYFTVVLDFGALSWNSNTWLEIEVAPGGSGNYTPLIPRKQITPTPQALYAKEAGSIDGGIGIDGGGTANYLAKFTSAKTLGNSLIYDNGANVGIGTISPASRLQVAGGAVQIGDDGIINYATGDGDLYVEDSLEVDGNVNFMSGIHYFHGTNYTTNLFSSNTTYSIGSATSHYKSVYAQKYYDGANTNYYLDPDNITTSLLVAGDVGIGTTSPIRKLSVNGDAGGTSAWNNDSDARLKKNVTTIENALQKVQQLRGVEFEWNETDNHPQGKQIGFIGQETETVVPEVVDVIDGNYSMQYAPLTALLVEAVKELKTENETLKQKLTEENQSLKQEINELKKYLTILINSLEGEGR